MANKYSDDEEQIVDLTGPQPLAAKSGPSSGSDVTDYTEIDNIYDDVTSSYGGMVTDNVYDELFADPIEKPRDCPAILELRDGSSKNIAHAELFKASQNDISVKVTPDDSERSLTLTTCCCIRLSSIPPHAPELRGPAEVDIIETVDGRNFQATIPAAQSFEAGLFGISLEENTPFKYLFFPYPNIKLRYQKRGIGDILVAKGFVTATDFTRSLEEHKQLRNLKLGHILAKQAKVRYALIDRTIQEAYKESSEDIQTGDILIKAGLVNQAQIEAALATQQRLKNRKIGQYLIEKGLIREEQLYVALADKFRIPFIDLRKEQISKNVVSLLPAELALKFQVLPLRQKQTTILIGTMTPERHTIKETLSRHTNGNRIQLAVVQPSHLKAAIKQLYQNAAKKD